MLCRNSFPPIGQREEKQKARMQQGGTKNAGERKPGESGVIWTQTDHAENRGDRQRV